MSDTIIGLGCCLFSGLLFGSMFTTIKKCDLRDGIFVQWVQSAAIFVCGFIINFIRSQPRFEPLAALGGLIFATGNLAPIPLISQFGVGLTILLCGSVQIIVGWATARFGLFGLKEQIPSDPVLNYIGVGMTLLSGVMFILVKNETTPSSTDGKMDTNYSSDNSPPLSLKVTHKKHGMVARIFQSKPFFLLLAVFAGTLFGQLLTPVVYAQDNVQGASQEGLDYVFSHFCGIFAGSTLYFIIYCAIKKNRPYISPELVLPSVVCGTMWAFGMTAWFISNKILSQAISFPIVTRIPGIIGTCWDVFYYKSIKGKKNLTLLSVAVGIALIGVILVGISK
uniref:Transmembrane protein 144 n=1 Tax=Plectus sambesii TaxID=2011161 RepID=A0A914WDJ4_9BILA